MKMPRISGFLAWGYAALLVIPFYYLVVSSLKENDDIFTHPLALPAKWDFGNYQEAISSAELVPAVANSVIVTGLA